MKKLIWGLCLAVILAAFSGCQTAPGGEQAAVPGSSAAQQITNSDGVADQQTSATGDIRPLPPKNPGNSLIEYDPNRTIYIGSEHIYMDYYIGFTKLPSFYFYIFSRQPLDPNSISVSFPVDLPFVVTVNDQRVEKKTMAMVEKTGGLGYTSMPYHVYQAYRGADDVYADFERLRSADLAEFHVYSVVVGLFNIRELDETVTLDKLDVTVGDEVYEAKLGRVRLLPAEEFPADYRVVMGKGITGNGCQLYNDGLSDLANVFEVNNAKEDMTITNLYMVEEESRILDISVLLKSEGMNVQMQWDGKTPIHVYKGDSIEIDVIIKNPHTEKLLNYVMCHIVTEFLNGNNEKVCAVNTQVGSEGRNLYEHYAIIFDGLDLEPYYRNSFYQLSFAWLNKFREH